MYLPSVQPTTTTNTSRLTRSIVTSAGGRSGPEQRSALKCGVRQPDRTDGPSRSGKSPDGIKVPVLISAISNIVVGLIWAATCFGIVFTIPMIILCIFEFRLWSKADNLSLRQLSGEAKTMGIFEIVVGLANTPTLICGIIVLINSGKLADR